MNKHNPKELNAAIKEAVKKGVKQKGMYNYLMFIPENNQNEEGYTDAKRFGYNSDTEEFDYLGNTDVMPFSINYEEFQMDFVPGGVSLFRRDLKKFRVSNLLYSDTVIG